MFRFRLDRVLRHRQRQVDACSREVAEAERSLREAEGAEQDVGRELESFNASAATQRQGALDVAALRQVELWQDQLHRRLAERRRASAAASREYEVAQLRLQAAWRDREVLRRLRERQYDEWKRKEGRRRQRELDEVGSIRAARGVGADMPTGRKALAGERKRLS